MMSVEVTPGERHEASVPDEAAKTSPLTRAWQTSRDVGKKVGLLAKNKPYAAMGVAAAAGVAAGVLVGTRLGRVVAAIAAGYAIHSMRENGEPILKTGMERLAKAIAV